jgi:hypothetical protein
MLTEIIEETTVGELSGVRVPMANMFTGSYELPDGSTAQGVVCALILPAGPTFVGLGSEVVVEGDRWRVTAIDKPSGGLGTVTLTRVE